MPYGLKSSAQPNRACLVLVVHNRKEHCKIRSSIRNLAGSMPKRVTSQQVRVCCEGVVGGGRWLCIEYVLQKSWNLPFTLLMGPLK